MTEYNFLNIHVLISHSPACLNRDDANMQKSAVFGGVRRVRISSQCLKRAMRKSTYYAEHLGKPSDRTRSLPQIIEKYSQALSAEFPHELVERTIQWMAREEDDEPDKKLAVAPWSVAEVGKVCAIAQEAGTDQKTLKKLFKEGAKGSKAAVIRQVRQALTSAVDIAFSGRMVTSGLTLPVDGAVSVAHPITTHAVDADIDWFTAVDDLVLDEGDAGAGHLNTQEFGAGVFYRYASVNLRQLQTNMGDVTRDQALIMAAHLVHMMATVVPEAKQHSFAAYNPADLVLVSFGHQPISAANAFEKPVTRDRQGGFLAPSIAAFEEYVNRVYAGYGLTDKQAVFSLWETKLASRCKTLKELKQWVAPSGQFDGGGDGG